jgi:hypothetical protein
MPTLSTQGHEVVKGLSNRHGFSEEASQHMLIAVFNGNGQMAQFSHPEFGGSGQWMRGGMTMIGDMFNNYLKGRVDSLCSDISTILQSQGGLIQSGSFQSQNQSGSGSQRQDLGGIREESNLFLPDPSQNWWPKELGHPNATGSQNEMHYAYFAAPCRLAVKTGNSVWVYDTQEHHIGGFSQQQGGTGSITFSSQFGTVNLSSLPVVMRDGQAISSSQNSFGDGGMSDRMATSSALPSGTNSIEGDVFTAIEKLGDLRAKGLLSDDEFSAKKKELLSRL